MSTDCGDSCDQRFFIYQCPHRCFFKKAIHDVIRITEAIERAKAYKKAGADGFFVPGLQKLTAIEALCQQCELPINIMLLTESPTAKQLAALGVARISYGPWPYQQMLRNLQIDYEKACYPST